MTYKEYGKIQLNTNKLCIHVYTFTFRKAIQVAPLFLPAPLPSHHYLDDCLIGIVGKWVFRRDFKEKDVAL